MVSDREYIIIVGVYNPVTVTAVGEKPGSWRLETYLGESINPELILDENTMEGFVVNEALNAWEYVNVDEQGRNQVRVPKTIIRLQVAFEGVGLTSMSLTLQVNGNSIVRNLRLRMQFPDRLVDGDTVEIKAPEGFSLEDPQSPGTCWNLTFVQQPGVTGVLPNSLVNCSQGLLTIQIRDLYPRESDLTFTLNTRNPPSTPFITRNWWIARHYATMGIQSSQAIEGWRIIPLLLNATVMVTGPLLRATVTSSVQVSFISISQADTVFVEVAEPLGFDFSAAAAYKSDPTAAPRNSLSVASQDRLVVTERTASSMRFQAEIAGGELLVYVITDVRLGDVGGPTRWHLHTSYFEVGPSHQGTHYCTLCIVFAKRRRCPRS